MTKDILSLITSNVKYSCDSTATDDVSSAVAVSLLLILWVLILGLGC